MIIRIIGMVVMILMDIIISIYVPKMAARLLELSVENAVLWGVVWYALLRLLNESTKYILELISFPMINSIIQNIQFTLCQKWHMQQSHMKEGELLTYFRRIGFALRTFYRYGVLNSLPAFYKLIISGIVFYRTGFIGKVETAFILIILVLPIFWWFDYFKTRIKGWEVTDQTGRVIHEFLHQKNWNALYQKKLENYLMSQLTQENQAWGANNMARNIFHLKKELGVAFLILVIFGSILLSHRLDHQQFFLIQAHFLSVLAAFNVLFTSILLVSESWAEFSKIYYFLKQPSLRSHLHFGKSIEIKGLSFSYDHNLVFKNFNLSINPNEKVLITGNNGTGKSTLMRILSGELVPQKGRIQRPETFVMIEQEPTLLTENLRFQLTFALVHYPTDEELRNVLERVYLSYMSLDRMISDEVSVGEKVKILIARALLEKPKALVLDESLRVLPEEQMNNILDEILRTIDTVIVISHHMSPTKFSQIIDI